MLAHCLPLQAPPWRGARSSGRGCARPSPSWSSSCGCRCGGPWLVMSTKVAGAIHRHDGCAKSHCLKPQPSVHCPPQLPSPACCLLTPDFFSPARPQEFVELVRAGQQLEAIAYARRHLAPWASQASKQHSLRGAMLACFDFVCFILTRSAEKSYSPWNRQASTTCLQHAPCAALHPATLHS